MSFPRRLNELPPRARLHALPNATEFFLGNPLANRSSLAQTIAVMG